MTLSDLLPKLHYPTRAEKLVDGWVHGVALVLFTLAVGAALGLAIWQGGLGMASAVAVYAFCVITMIGCSMAYNLAETTSARALLRRFDHAAIFLMIAGSYTPFTTLRFDGAWAIWMTSIVWALADRRRRETVPARPRRSVGSRSMSGSAGWWSRRSGR